MDSIYCIYFHGNNKRLDYQMLIEEILTKFQNLECNLSSKILIFILTFALVCPKILLLWAKSNVKNIKKKYKDKPKTPVFRKQSWHHQDFN